MDKLYQAVLANNVSAVRALLNPINQDVAIKKELIELMHYVDGEGNSALHIAAKNGKLAILSLFFSSVFFLTDKKVIEELCQKKNSFQKTPLDLALESEDINCIACFIIHFSWVQTYLTGNYLENLKLSATIIQRVKGFLKHSFIHDLPANGNAPGHVKFPSDINKQLDSHYAKLKDRISIEQKKALDLKKPLLIISAEQHCGIKGELAKLILAHVCRLIGIQNFCIEAEPTGIASWFLYSNHFFCNFIKFCIEPDVKFFEVDCAIETKSDSLTDEDLLVTTIISDKRNQHMINNIRSIKDHAVLFVGSAHAKAIYEGLKDTAHVFVINSCQISREEDYYLDLVQGARFGSAFIDPSMECNFIYSNGVYQNSIPGDEIRPEKNFGFERALSIFNEAFKDKITHQKMSKKIIPSSLEEHFKKLLEDIEQPIPEDSQIFGLINHGFEMSDLLKSQFRNVLVYQYTKVPFKDAENPFELAKNISEYLDFKPPISNSN